jgi:hypothetical protein
MKRLLVLLPVLLTTLLLVFTAIVYRYSNYGSWHIYPALAVAPLVILCHIALIIWGTPRGPLVLYAVTHVLLLVPVWFWCLMWISKDSL